MKRTEVPHHASDVESDDSSSPSEASEYSSHQSGSMPHADVPDQKPQDTANEAYTSTYLIYKKKQQERLQLRLEQQNKKLQMAT